ncbi:MAG TPA: NAD(P)-dependent oxidoreductase [Bacteroidota bacterium]|nr:NAD(P)-dependent oxidoreductase [Bacteroidota bacterium]
MVSKGVAFLTGATGFIGSRVLFLLCEQGWKVRALVRNPEKAGTGLEGWDTGMRQNVEFVKGDLFAGTPSDRMKLFSTCLDGAEFAIHLAEAKTQEKDFDVKNIKAVGLLLEAAAANESLQRFVLVSAFMAGGLPQPLPKILTEEMTGVEFPDRYYRWKRMAERLVMKTASHSRFSFSIVRPALVYGPNAQWLVPMLKIIKRMGKYYLPLSNGGTALLGTVHVEDVANTIASSGWSDHARNQIIHAADNGGTTYRDWIQTIATTAGWKVHIGRIPPGFVYGTAKAADTVTALLNLHYGANLWAQVLTVGCAYSNEKMVRIVGRLKNPTIYQGVPQMMEWFARTHP